MKPQHIALAWFLILVTIGVIIVLSIAIVVRRGVSRRKSRIDRNVYTPYGYGLSKAWKESVERRINNTVRIRTEPRVLNDHYQENWEKYIQEKNITFLFRAKALDDFLQLKENILTICPELESPPIRGIHAFLMTAREQAMSPTAPKSKIEDYCRLYLRARYDLDAFGEEQYEQFHKLHSELVQYVARAIAIRNASHPTTPSGSSRRGSSRLFSFNSRATSFTRIHGHQSGKSPATFSKSHSGISIHRLGSSSTNNSAKPLSGSMQLPHPLHQTDRDNGSEPRSTGVCLTTTTTDDSITLHVPQSETLTTTHMAYTSRRDSCQSDGSQTALIDIDPVVRGTSKGPVHTTRSRSRSNEAFETIEMRPMLHSHTDDLTNPEGLRSSTLDSY